MFKKKFISPLISIILLIVVTVILISVVLTWSSNFTESKLNVTDEMELNRAYTDLLFVNQVNEYNFILKNSSDKNLRITHYEIVSNKFGDEYYMLNTKIPLPEPITLDKGAIGSFPLVCHPEPSFKINLITDQNIYFSLNISGNKLYSDNCINNNNVPDKVCLGLLGNGSGNSEEDPFVVCSVEDLNNIRNNLSGFYKLGKNIDLGIAPYNTAEGWMPIGSSSNPFIGVLDGQDHVIKNLYIYRPNSSYQGLFGYNIESLIKNLILEDVNITGNDYIGAVIGRSYYPNNLIDNCKVNGVITGQNSVGGITGNLQSSIATNTSFVGKIKGANYVGGITGHTGNSNSGVYNSEVIADINGIDNIGGIVGLNRYGKNHNNVSKGTIVGNNNVGGLFGVMSYGTLYDSYSSSKVSGNNFVGGVVGRNDPNGTLIEYNSVVIINCLYFGKLSSVDENYGGLISTVEGTGYAISNSYWDINKSGVLVSTVGEGRTTEDLTYPYSETVYSGWNFNTIWKEDNNNKNNGYPYLQWQDN